ncbi:hypothetical protein [Parasphingopyxis algicola]|uniref:hypothetical protein n=1 Tax=Parasphingopyxis algicola TaxID=2026624 RepID=UPI001FE9CCCF|nr:hypothetical protein [Parasphingopyxis algicola]
METIALKWAKPSETERDEVRWNATPEEFAAFYETVMPHIDAILDHLSNSQPKDLDAAERHLFYLACALAEATPHHELYNGSAQVPFSFDARRFVPAHGKLDSASGSPS